MTCQEFRLYFEDPLRCDDELRTELEHLAQCSECARFVESQRELGSNLRLVRESAPAFPPSLDTDVLANYRKHIVEQTRPAITLRPRRSLTVLRWGAVAAALVLIAVLLFIASRKEPGTIAQPQQGPAIKAPESQPVERTTQVAQPKAPSARIPKTHRRVAFPTVATTSHPLPPGFRSLMYCDELSCGDFMEVIRVQLQPSAPSSSYGGPVFADVLVGSDGIARGIRVVE
jgi:hypothetical protein